MINKVDICKTTRLIASETLEMTLRNFFRGNNLFSEKEFRDKWLDELRKNTSIFPDGWYLPPPHGLSVLFGPANRKSRVNYKSLRSEDMWPKENIFLKQNNDMAYFFASPVNRQKGIIGDFGLTVYIGNNQKVKDHLRRCYEINLQIFNFIETGMSFSEVYKYAEKIIVSKGLENQVTSITDPAGRDIGHTIPVSYFEWSEDEKKTLEGPDWKKTKDMISKKRVFVSSVENLEYQPGMAVTVEPRLIDTNDLEVPMSSFHTLIIIKDDGKKELLTNFEEIFRLCGMEYILN